MYCIYCLDLFGSIHGQRILPDSARNFFFVLLGYIAWFHLYHQQSWDLTDAKSVGTFWLAVIKWYEPKNWLKKKLIWSKTKAVFGAYSAKPTWRFPSKSQQPQHTICWNSDQNIFASKHSFSAAKCKKTHLCFWWRTPWTVHNAFFRDQNSHAFSWSSLKWWKHGNQPKISILATWVANE